MGRRKKRKLSPSPVPESSSDENEENLFEYFSDGLGWLDSEDDPTAR